MKFLVYLSIFTLVLALPSAALAQDGEGVDTQEQLPPEAAQMQTDDVIQDVKTAELTGEVLKIENNQLTVKTKEGETKQFSINEMMKVTRDGSDATAADIEPGDKATVQYSQDGEVLALSADSGMGMNILLWAIPAVILLGLLAYFVMKSKNSGKIKTEVAGA